MSPGGVAGYVRRARGLLADSRDGKNPFDGYVPSVPAGITLQPMSTEFLDYGGWG